MGDPFPFTLANEGMWKWNANFQNSQAEVGMIIFHISGLIKQCLTLTFLDYSHSYPAKVGDT